MFKELGSQLIVLLIFLTVAFAWWKGGRPERIGSLFNAILAIGVVLFQTLTDRAFGTVPILIADGLLATGFLILALRYASLWLAAAMVLQAAAFLIHAALLMTLLPEGNNYYLIMNLLGVAVMVTILLGTVGAWLRNRRRPSAAPA